MRTLLALYYNYSWRRSEAAKHLKVSQIDLGNRTILLSRYSTKNRQPKRLEMCQEVYELLSMCVTGKGITRKCGSPVGDFRKAWRNICNAAGVSGCWCMTSEDL